MVFRSKSPFTKGTKYSSALTFTLIFTLAVVFVAWSNEPALGQGKSGEQARANIAVREHNRATTSDSSTNVNADRKGNASRLLQGLNAYRANPNAAMNANENSIVGQIAAYRSACEVTESFATQLAQANDELTVLIEEYESRSVETILAEIAALDSAANTFLNSLATLEAELVDAETLKNEIGTLQQVVSDQEASYEVALQQEDALLSIAAGDRSLTDTDVEQIREEVCG